MRRIAVASGKGGVGRTTLVANLGIALASLGKETIIIDGNLTTPDLALLFKLEKSVYTLNDALAGEAMLADVIRPGPKRVKIVPAAVALEQIRKARVERLPELMNQVPKKTEFVLVDVPSGLRRETICAMRAGHEVLMVATPEMTSISDVMKTRLIAEFLGLTPIGVVLNRVRREEFELTRDEIMNVTVLAEIPEDEKVKQALKRGKPLLELSPKSPAAKAIKELAEKLLKVKAMPASETTIPQK